VEGVGLEGDGIRGAHSPIPEISSKTFFPVLSLQCKLNDSITKKAGNLFKCQ